MAEESTKCIVIAVDNSECSERAFHWYMDNLHKKENRLVVFHCYEHSHAFSKVTKKEEWGKLGAEEDQKVKDLETKYKAKLEVADANGEVVIVGGHVGDEICKRGVLENATLIVVGTRNRGVLTSAFLGSTSKYVLHHSHIPVFIIPKLG